MDAVIEGYGRSLELVLRHQTATLVVTALTLVITVWLYVVMPKGFLPAQDTGLITAVLEAEPQVSFTELSRLQAEVTGAVRKDPAVEGVVSVVGVGQLNPTPNVSHLKITLKPRAERERAHRRRGRPAGARGGGHPRRHRLLPAGAGRADRHPHQPRAVPVHARQHRRGEVTEWTKKLAAELASSPVAERREPRDHGHRPARAHRRRPRGRGSARRHRAGGERRAERRLRAAAGVDHLRAGEPVPRRAGGDAAVPQRPLASSTGSTFPRPTAPGAADRHRQDQHTTAPFAVSHQDQFPSETISFNLEPHAALSDAVTIVSRRRGEDRHAVIGHRQLLRRRQRVRLLAAQPAVADPRRHRDDLHRAGRALRELRPSVHDPDDAAVGRHRRAAGADVHGPRSVAGGADRHRAADGHRQEERHHDDRLRARRRARARAQPRDSIVEAALLRFRPIMMTTLAALFGALPLAIESGVGSELRNPLGITIVGGLLLSQLLTLYTTPVIYLAMERLRVALRRARRPARHGERQRSRRVAP